MHAPAALQKLYVSKLKFRAHETILKGANKMHHR